MATVNESMFEYGGCLHPIPVSVGDSGSANPQSVHLQHQVMALMMKMLNRIVIVTLPLHDYGQCLSVHPPICGITPSRSKVCGCVVA